jgi:polysaccharide biosynthesis/export protein
VRLKIQICHQLTLLNPGLDKKMTRPAQSLVLLALSTFVSTTALTATPSSSQQTPPPSPLDSPSNPSSPSSNPNSFSRPNRPSNPSSSSNPTSAATLSNINQADYVLGPGDQIKIDMFGQNELFVTPYNVLVDGSLTLPFVGRAFVGGRTIREAEADITSQYKKYFKRPYLTLVLVKPRQLTLAVSGEVVKPGTYPFTGVDQIPTVSQLLKLSGGVTPSANLRNIQVRRSKFDQPSKYDTITVDLMKLIREGDISQDIRLRDGDILVVQASEKPSIEDFAAAVNSSFAADNTQPLNIAVVGQVFRPGPYVVQAGNSVVGAAGSQGTASGGGASRNLPTVSQAIQLAGGIRPEADVRKIQVRRVSRAGNEQLLSVDLQRLLVEGDIRQDIPLQQGDTVVVSKAAVPLTAEELQFISDTTLSPSTIDVNVVGEVVRPGSVKIKPNTPLNTAVLAAGGFNERRANKSAVKLIRLNPDGTVSERKIKLSFNASVNEETNPPLRNNDVVVVSRSGFAAFGDATSGIFGTLGSFSFLRTIVGF